MPPTTPQHLGAAWVKYCSSKKCPVLIVSPELLYAPLLLCSLYTHYSQAASRCCLLPSSLSVLSTTQQPLGAVAYYPAASRCCRLLPSSLSVLSPTTQQPLGAAYYPTASRCCRLIPSSILVLPPTTQQHLGAVAYYPAASRCCLLPSSISVLPPTQQHLGAAYYPAASRCCRLLPSSIPVLPTNSLPTCRRSALPYPQHQHPIHMPGAAYPPASWCCPLPNSISVLPTTKQHLGAAAYHQAAPQCCLLTRVLGKHIHPAHTFHDIMLQMTRYALNEKHNEYA